jgi:hypothetical protein
MGINSATAVLRGLLYMVVQQQPSLVSHIRKKDDHAGQNLFEDTNAWVALTEIFADMLRDASLSTTYLIIDALDECVTGLPKLLSFTAKQSSASSRVKWIVASLNWPAVEEQLEAAEHKTRLSMELNAESVPSLTAKRALRQNARPNHQNCSATWGCRTSHNSYYHDIFWWRDLEELYNILRYKYRFGVLIARPRCD